MGESFPLPSIFLRKVKTMDRSQCQDCGKIFADDQLETITHGIWERVAPGEPMPSGECPECGALCQPYEADTPQLLEVLKTLTAIADKYSVTPDNAPNYKALHDQFCEDIELAQAAIARAEKEVWK